jgi:hypothetical protein
LRAKKVGKGIMVVPERGHLILPFHGRELDFNKTPTSLKKGGGGFLKDVHYILFSMCNQEALKGVQETAV